MAATSAVVLALVTTTLEDHLTIEREGPWSFLHAGEPEGLRVVLTAIISSVITVVALVFSITVVTLTLTTSKFGPRLLRTFMRDRVSQMTLGVLIATFLYCLFVLKVVQTGEEYSRSPHISMLIAIVMTVGSLGMLIFFVDHIAASIQAESVVAEVGEDLSSTIRRNADSIDAERSVSEDALERARRDLRHGVPILSTHEGYVQAVGIRDLVDIAVEMNAVIELLYRPGHFIIRDSLLARVGPPGEMGVEIADRIRGAIMIGNRRTDTQDIEYAITQLVEVALRALSPGINETFTAINCIERLGAAIALLCRSTLPPEWRTDESGNVRLLMQMVTFRGFVDSAFHQIRQSGRSNEAVMIKLIDTLGSLAEHVQSEEQRNVLLSHVELLHTDAAEMIPAESDREDVRARYERAKSALRDVQFNPK